jgi:hypothetical protein
MSIIAEEMFDTRKIERFLQEGKITPEQYEAHLASLEDCADNTDTSHVNMVGHNRGRRIDRGDESPVEEDEG